MSARPEREHPAIVVNLRGVPDLKGRSQPAPLQAHSDRLGERNALIVFAAADSDSEADRLGLGAVLYVAGPSVALGAVLVPRGISRARLRAVQAFAKGTPISSQPGAPSFEVLSLRKFFAPTAHAEDGLAFAPTAYVGRCSTIGYDLGRFFGLAAGHVVPFNDGTGWSVFPPGWGGEERHRTSPNRPEIILKARRDGWQCGWGWTGWDPDTGERYGSKHPGSFVDIASLAYVLDADRGASFGEHRENLGLGPYDLPVRLPVSAAGALGVIEAVRALHETALSLDLQAGRWFTTDEDRARGHGQIDLARTSSPGALAADVLRRFRVVPALDKFALPSDLHKRWWESFHGGRCHLHEPFRGVCFPCAAADVSSAFPSGAVLLGWWNLLTAASIHVEDVTAEVVALRRRAAADPRAALDPEVWGRLGFTIVTERLRGERRHVEIEDPSHPAGRSETVAVYSPGRLLHHAWPDSVAGAIDAGHAEGAEVVRALRLVPSLERQRGLRRKLPLLPGVVLDSDEDPAVALVRLRRAVKQDDPVLESVLHAVVNSLVSGILSRCDSQGSGEVPGPWCFIPIASCVQAGARLYLACFERLVRDRGGVPVYCDTDSWLTLTSPRGGTFALPDGTERRALSWPEVDEVIATFDSMRPFGTDVPPWKLDSGEPDRPLHSVAYLPKRHVELLLGDDGVPEVVERTEANLGGFFADPPRMSGRGADGLRRWTFDAIGGQVAHSLAPDHEWPEASWDAGSDQPALAVRRLQVRSPETLRSLPKALGARVGSFYAEAVAGEFAGMLGQHNGAVALDTGEADPWDLRWLDRKSGLPVRLSLDPADLSGHIVATLDDKAISWGKAPRIEALDELHVDPLLVQHRGRQSGVIDAEVDGLPGDLGSHRPVYDPEGDAARRLSFVQARATAMGPRRFARRTGLPLRTAKRAALGQRIGAASVKKALRALRYADSSSPRCLEDNRPIVGRRDGSTYCSELCSGRAARRRRAERMAAKEALT